MNGSQVAGWVVRSSVNRRRFAARPLLAFLTLLGLSVGCGDPTSSEDDDAIVVAAVLPFTGEEAAIGQNLEQALLLAIEDVNAAGGIDGRRLKLKSGDSNSGSERGLDALLDILYDEQVRYLIGPEENELANEIVVDIKGLDVFNILPGYASPSIERSSRSGGWLRLPPSSFAFGCGLAELATEGNVETANTITARDDFNQSVASEFTSEFLALGGVTLPSTTIQAGAASYAARTTSALNAGVDRTLLIVNPTTASTIITEWAVSGLRGAWIFGPTLHTPGLLTNIPFQNLNETLLLSPTLSLTSECEPHDDDFRGAIECGRENAARFGRYYAARWDGDAPFPAAHFYYDAVVLLALGLQYAHTHDNPEPTAKELHDLILDLMNDDEERVRWNDVPTILRRSREGQPMRYVGAAAEYEFDRFGAAKHFLFDRWRITDQRYVDDGTMRAQCLRVPL